MFTAANLLLDKFSKHSTGLIFFTDEKLFAVVPSPDLSSVDYHMMQSMCIKYQSAIRAS